MTDKQIIIDGVDVSECEYYWIFEEACMGGRWKSTINYLCKDNPDCLYKQLKRLQAEHELLQNQYNAVVEQNRQLHKELNVINSITISHVVT